MRDRILASDSQASHPLAAQRRARGWTQGQLAERARVPRSTVSAIEGRRLTPSVSAALALSRALERSVEQLFGAGGDGAAVAWAWTPLAEPARYWSAEVAGRTWAYPAEAGRASAAPHDGVASGARLVERGPADPGSTLVLAGCDPAAALLAASFANSGGGRMLAFQRGGEQALELLATGRVHVAALHRSTPDDPERNARTVRERLGVDAVLLRAAEWDAGIALPRGSGLRSAESCRRRIRRWAVREPGSAARDCLAELVGRPLPKGRVWRSHAAVAEAVQGGFAEAGVCVRLCAEEAGLAFVPLRSESLELCFPAALEDDPRIQALIRLVGSREHRERLRDLPGYDATHTGALRRVSLR